MPLEDARISPLDHGLTVGDGVFETMRVYDAVPFAWRRHFARLARVGRRRSGSTFPTPTRCAPAPTRCSPPTICATRACASPSPAAPRRPARRADPACRAGRLPRRDPDRHRRADGRRRDRAVDAQRARRDRRTEDDLVRGERPRARLRGGTRRERSDLRQHPGQPVRGDGLERVPRARRRRSSRPRRRPGACSA